jgi:5-methylcytosine-specific restriction protein A
MHEPLRAITLRVAKGSAGGFITRCCKRDQTAPHASPTLRGRGVSMRTRCLECRGWATHSGRCALHHSNYNARRSIKSHSKRRAAIARGNNAAARLRRKVRAIIKSGELVRCAHCPGLFLGSAVDIDHIKPLALGGEDVDENVQVLCKACHKAKTRTDFPRKNPPF